MRALSANVTLLNVSKDEDAMEELVMCPFVSYSVRRSVYTVPCDDVEFEPVFEWCWYSSAVDYEFDCVNISKTLRTGSCVLVIDVGIPSLIRIRR